jgi:predicted nuclease with TOPRIM domain
VSIIAALKANSAQQNTHLMRAEQSLATDKLNTMTDKVGTMADKVDTVEVTQSLVTDKLNTMTDKVGTMTDKVGTMADKVDTVEVNTNSRVSKQDAMIKSLSDQVAMLTAQIAQQEQNRAVIAAEAKTAPDAKPPAQETPPDEGKKP